MVGGDALQIRATDRADATCIAEGLREFEARVEAAEGEWVVIVPAVVSHELTTAVLGALKTCLERFEIALVKVELGKRTYVMEGAI